MARIALCDDNKTTLFGLTKKLSKAGHDIVGKANDGNEGMSLYLSQKPDLMLLDVTMPNMGGKECLQGILQADPKAKIIMISGVQDESIIQQCLMIGAKAYISKANIFDENYFNNEVLATINKILHDGIS
jgi:two-component system chemotaxis response regulator CheY